jgi:hypothetical protein
MPTYNVLSHLLHDGAAYNPGDTVEMTDEQASPLRSVGVVGEAASEVEHTDDELIEKIKAAATVADIDALVGKIKRKPVIEAARVRMGELTQA